MAPARWPSWPEVSDKLARRVGRQLVVLRAHVAGGGDDQRGGQRHGGAGGALASRFMAATAFAQPEILALGEDTVRAWAAQEPRLMVYGHAFHNLFRRQAHVRSAEVEEALALAVDPFSQVENTQEMLIGADMKFPPATSAGGEAIPLAQGNVETLLDGADREARRTAWENYMDVHLSLKNTLASNYLASVRRDVFYARARRYNSALEGALFAENIPTRCSTAWWTRSRRTSRPGTSIGPLAAGALGVETLHPYDIWAPLSKYMLELTYPQAVDWICAGMAPLGEEYVAALRKGCRGAPAGWTFTPTRARRPARSRTAATTRTRSS